MSLVLIVVVAWSVTPAAFAACGSSLGSRSELDNRWIPRASKITLPRGELVKLPPREILDPFRAFVAAGRPLVIANEGGTLSVSVGGSTFRDGADGEAEPGPPKIKVSALGYSKLRQRYLVSRWSRGSLAGQLLINVELRAQSAKVWTRERDNLGAMSDWQTAAIYGAEPTGAALRPIDAGLIGERADGRAVVAVLDLAGGTPRMIVANGPTMLSGPRAAFVVSAEMYRAVARGDLPALDKLTETVDGQTIRFDVDGADHLGRPRLRLVGTTASETIRLSGCSPWSPTTATR